jgi:hypothetical protein
MTRQPNESDVDFIYRCETEWMEAQGPNSEFRLNLYGRSLFGMAPGLLNIEREERSSGARALEAAYQNDVNGNASSFGEGSTRDFLYGLLMGFGCGYMMLFCMWDRNISQRQKLGILAGMVLSLLFSLFMQTGKRSSAGHLRQGDSSSGIGGGVGSVGGVGQGLGGVEGAVPGMPEIPVIDSGGSGLFPPAS